MLGIAKYAKMLSGAMKRARRCDAMSKRRLCVTAPHHFGTHTAPARQKDGQGTVELLDRKDRHRRPSKRCLNDDFVRPSSSSDEEAGTKGTKATNTKPAAAGTKSQKSRRRRIESVDSDSDSDDEPLLR